MLKLLIFSGTSRKGNTTQTVAEFVTQVVGKQEGIEVTLIDPQALGVDLNKEADGSQYPELKKQVAKADGFIVVAPEYNHGYPASLKFMLDLNLKEYIHKPVATVGVSAGPFGGTRVIENLLPVYRELGLVATSADLNVSGVKSEFVDGEVQDADKWEKRVDKMLDELVWMAETLKAGRASS